MINPTHISAIVAMDENRVIGNNNQLPWHMPADLKRFKTITTGNIILMGRKTYESIGKPLPNRMNLIMTRDASFKAADCKIITSIKAAINLAEKNHKKLFVIGGAEIFDLCLPYVQYIYLTIIHHKFAGDAFFPKIKKEEWQEIKREDFAADEKNIYSYSFIELQRLPQDTENRS